MRPLLPSQRPARLRPARRREVVVNLWASWCDLYRREAPRFAAAGAAYRDGGVIFVGVEFQDREGDARAFIADYGLRYPNGADRNGGSTRDYGARGLPATFVIGRDQIARRRLGEIAGDQLPGFLAAPPR